MNIANFFCFIGNVILRGAWYLYIAYHLLRTMHENKDWAFFYGGLAPLFVFTIFNFMYCILPYYVRMMKFLHYTPRPYEVLPEENLSQSGLAIRGNGRRSDIEDGN